MTRRIAKGFAIMCLSMPVLLGGHACGYYMLNAPKNQTAKLYIKPFSADASETGIAGLARKELITQLGRAGYRITWSEQKADFVITGKVHRLSTRPGIRVSTEDQSSQSYQLYTQLSVSIYAPNDKRVWYSGRKGERETFMLGQGLGTSAIDIILTEANRRRALRGVAKSLSQQIMFALKQKNVPLPQKIQQTAHATMDACTDCLLHMPMDSNTDACSEDSSTDVCIKKSRAHCISVHRKASKLCELTSTEQRCSDGNTETCLPTGQPCITVHPAACPYCHKLVTPEDAFDSNSDKQGGSHVPPINSALEFSESGSTTTTDFSSDGNSDP